MNLLNPKAIVAAVVGLLALIAIPNCVEYLDARHVMVIQYPNGAMQAFTEPGPKAQWFGTVTKYERRAEYRFGTKGDTEAIRIRFNDGGHADMVGAVSWEIPTKPELLLQLQREFASQAAVEQQLVARALTNAVYFTGPLMSSTESSGERRAEMLQYIDDQARAGVYQTRTRSERQMDPLTKVEKVVNIVEIEREKDGTAKRNQVSALGKYGVSLLQLAVTDIKYDKIVEEQIAQRQNAITQVQIALANARRAEQDALTIAKQGEATAAKTKWEQEAIKAKEVTKAEQEKAVAVTAAEKEKEVARLSKEAAEFTKTRDILLGQGESEKRRLILAADGALQAKLDAYVAVNNRYAQAIENYKGNWVPGTVMGGGAGGANGATTLLDLFTAKTARDLQLDMSVKKPGQ